MGDENETSLLVGLISDERDTSFIIKLSLTAVHPAEIAYLCDIMFLWEELSKDAVICLIL